MTDPRLVAAAVTLQIYGRHDPDSSRYLAERVVRAVDRAATRGHAGSGPTQTEVARATAALVDQGVPASPAQVHRALFAALCPEPFARAS